MFDVCYVDDIAQCRISKQLSLYKLVKMERSADSKNIIPTAILNYYLYGKNVVNSVDMRYIHEKEKSSIEQIDNNEELTSVSTACVVSQRQYATLTPLQSLQKLVNPKRNEDSLKMTYAMTSFPDEVELCTSSIPGCLYGVAAKRPLPRGTVVGPYEGRRTFHLHEGEKNHEYVWEQIYADGKLSYFIDGSDENCSSWMRFIRFARSVNEQNMTAYQHGESIYYQAFCDINIGEELLVWYSDCYDKYLEIPVNLKRVEGLAGKTCLFSVVNVSHSNDRTSDIQEKPLSSGTSLFQNSVRHDKIQPSSEKGFSQLMLRNEGDRNILLFNKGNTNDVVEAQQKNDYPSDESLSLKCKQCNGVFAQRIQLQIHVCPKQPYKPYVCGHCSESFDEPLELRNHVVIHTSERPFKCGFCGRTYAGATTLNNHVRMHTGEKPFVCRACGKMFAIATQLARHTRVPGECPSNLPTTQR
ncbi:putative histone-lysine N-methyltransferase PRDM6 isoform X2 [Xenia sp. Carnegie-2017]|uniref:putative histone-lysine N-methyltransferase PRDM6 isoform X2 n=2 Tax=Xenia sp. Carnegie-2017 TaxID=2897299 RepID=UPI001F049E4D|nr:putative histone-lysine N-methyltransferase PRDM6 isoform X2 [Xenia sp. Carnegie-2017]